MLSTIACRNLSTMLLAQVQSSLQAFTHRMRNIPPCSATVKLSFRFRSPTKCKVGTALATIEM